ncbi:type II toxin-antitoxin system RelE/ParE family toxin [Haloferula sp.]|uniref:type II toxin-antitoxin system RelE/ParE family toxin n=1 Tax=Haloferula sp. TaxID=2497595 RepID=UPI003C711E72
MTIIFHRLVRSDLRLTLEYYDARSNTAGDRLYEAFADAVARIKQSPYRCHPIDAKRRRCKIRGFPYHLVFEIEDEMIFITVMRHDRRSPSYGLRRRRN